MADHYPFEAEKYVLIGKVTKAHGIKGELKVRAFSDQPQSIIQHKQLLLVSSHGQLSPVFDIVRARIGNKEVIIHLQGVNDRSQAEELCGMGVLVTKEALPALDAEEFYLHELEGLQVKTEEGVLIGKVDGFFNNGAQDLLVVKSGKDEVLIPLIPGMITERNENYLTIAPPPGLLEINSGESGLDI